MRLVRASKIAKSPFPQGWGGGRRAMCCTMTSSRCRARPTHTRVPCAKGSTQVISAVHTHTITHHSVSPLSLRIERARLRLRLPLQLPHHPCPGLALHRCICPQRVCHSLRVVCVYVCVYVCVCVRVCVSIQLRLNTACHVVHYVQMCVCVCVCVCVELDMYVYRGACLLGLLRTVCAGACHPSSGVHAARSRSLAFVCARVRIYPHNRARSPTCTYAGHSLVAFVKLNPRTQS